MPKVIDHDQRRQDIVNVARKVILKGGFEAATMRSIAAEAGFANGALKHYFPGKDSIVAATFESILDELGERIDASDSEDAGERMRQFLSAPLPHSTEDIAAGRVLLALWEYAMSNEELADLYRRHLAAWEQRFIDRLTDAYAAGAIAVPPPYDGLALEYISATIGAAVVNLMHPDGELLPGYEAFLERFLSRLQ